MANNSNKEVQLENIIHGRIEPFIYAFSTDKVPHYLKVGDTYRGVDVRIAEWEKVLDSKVVKVYEHEAKADEDIYFRDYSVHNYLKAHNHPQIEKKTGTVLYSKEFFKDADADDVKKGIDDIIEKYKDGTPASGYTFYNINDKVVQDFDYKRTEDWPLRESQTDVVTNFMNAYDDAKKKNKKHIDLLMYAVMRFGKSYTALHCAKAMKAKFVIVVSAKADVQTEWKKNVKSPKQLTDFEFVDDKNLKEHSNDNYIEEKLRSSKCLVLVLTLQTLNGDKMKGRHKQIFKRPCDLLIVDETHYGAWADKYGAVIRNDKDEKKESKRSRDDDFVDANDEVIKKIKSKVTLHLSGTPYRLLQGKEFRKEQLISYCSMADIARAQKEWYETFEQSDESYEEWQNPYFGFPEMLRFGFNLNSSSRDALEELSKQGFSTNISTLFRTKSLKKSNNNDYKTFIFEDQVLDLLKIIDGSKSEDDILSFLNLKEIKKGKLCEHIVMVLPYCASCDAMEKLLLDNQNNFINLKCGQNYKIINISGIDGKSKYKSPESIKKVIEEAEKSNQKTLTLTVNRMMTGSTVKQWDTMIYLKSSESPQEYDQATFRIQSQNVETIKQGDTIIKRCKKPQTLLIDFDLNRLFLMQEQKSSFYDMRNKTDRGNSEIEKRIDDELKYSPILVMNGSKIEKVDGLDVLKAVSDYHATIGIKEEAAMLPVDYGLVASSKAFKEAMQSENEIGSNKGFRIERKPGETNIETGEEGSDSDDFESPDNSKAKDNKAVSEESIIRKKVQNYYARILVFAFICDQNVISLKDIIGCFKNKEQKDVLKNLGLSKDILQIMQNKMSAHVLSKLDYSIQDMNELSHNKEKTPEEIALIAVKKFNAFGSNEIPTSNKICLDMIEAIPEKDLVLMLENESNILDINSKTGEFAVAIYQKVKHINRLLNKNINVSKRVFSIPSSLFTKEIVKKVYTLLGLDHDNIAGFTSEELTNKNKTIKGKKKREKYFQKLLEQDIKFCDIHIE